MLDEKLDGLLDGLRAGDADAENEFWRLYGEPLERVAERRLSPQIQARVGPEDIALSACRTFLRRARLGEFRVPDSAALWKLLCVITLTKVREQVRYHRRQKRNVEQEIRFDRPATDSGAVDFADPNTHLPDAEEFANQLAALLGTLPEDERAIVELKLQDQTNDQIAQHLGSSERTVRRLLKRVAERLAPAADNV